MPFNTRNPIPSGDLRDLDDNARNIDTWANDKTKLSHPDRFGVQRYTWHGIEQKAKLDLSDAVAGATAEAGQYRDQALDAKNAAQEAAMMSGFSKYSDTLAQLESGIGTDYIEGDVVMVFQDESRGDTSSIFKIEAGAAEFKLTFDKTRQDLLSFTGNINATPSFDTVPSHSDPAFDVQTQALTNRTEYLSENLGHSQMVFSTLEAAETSAAALPDGQHVKVLELESGFVVSGGALASQSLEAITYIRSVKNISELRRLSGSLLSGAVYIAGHTTAFDGGQGIFDWSPSASFPDDNGAHIMPNGLGSGNAGRWVRRATVRVSPLMWGAKGNASIEDTEACRRAVSYLLSARSGVVKELDLLGLEYAIAGSLAADNGVIPVGKRIHSGKFRVVQGFNGHILDVRTTLADTNTNWLSDFKVYGIDFLCGLPDSGRCFGAIASNKAHGVHYFGNTIRGFTGAGILDETARAACEVKIEGNRIDGAKGDSEGVLLSGYDSEIIGANMIRNCKRGIHTLLGGVKISGANHIYECTEYSIYNESGGLNIVDNYIDNAPIKLRNPGNSPMSINDNKFLATSAAMASESPFVIFAPVGDTVVRGVVSTGNNFNANNGRTLVSYAVDTTEGNITAAQDCFIKDNGYRNVRHKTTHPSAGSSDFTNATSSAVDLSAQTLFGPIIEAEATFKRAAGGSAIPAVAVTGISSGVVSVGMSAAATGKVLVKGNVNINWR